MTAVKLDGRATAAAIKAELAERVAKLKAAGVTPGIATVLVGADPASQLYVGMKHRESEAIGMNSIQVELPADATQADVEAEIDRLNADPSCHGYIVQLPLPRHLDTDRILERIDPAKDADGLHPVNLGRLVQGVPRVLPCTPAGILRLLADHGIDLTGRHVVVIGRGLTIGRPLANLVTLKRPDANAAVTVVHTGIADIAPLVRTADVVVAAAGSPRLITADMVAPGAVVVAAGVSFEDGRVVSDVDDDVAEVASWLSPRIGGVGPMTRAMLLANTVAAAEVAWGGGA